jgi:hypothetical protein
MKKEKKKRTVLISEAPLKYHLSRVQQRILREAEEYEKEGYQVVVQCGDGRKMLFSTWKARQKKAKEMGLI